MLTDLQGTATPVVRHAWLRLVHYWWPLALGWSLTVVVGRGLGREADPAGRMALLSGILCAYSLDRSYGPAGSGAGTVVRGVLRAVAVASGLVCAVSALRLPAETAVLVPVLAVAALAYPQLKRLPTTKLVLLPLVWVWGSAALPFNSGSWAGWRVATQPVVVPLLLLVAAGSLLCDLKDEADDRARGVWSLPARLGAVPTLRVAATLALAATAMAALERPPAVAVGGVVLGASTLAPSVLATDIAGPLLVDVILTLPGLLIAARLE